ncbi:phosphoribosylanthranilate isomerase [Litoreibacter roseus]|uniref:N-(5'-phosphoribosyl)anthranilate isomerase n=1 Tax=Litoreibacter roseus TaxID=2601869 RepID=A0A6N6JA86_9RHOB|nr:phosphoribosylanthranilate isomerase [Litoreibacter roseus]GFE63095.1 N-(5'-phosphoribosyl)anthranilate isomerase [Litoreibacter roseus]
MNVRVKICGLRSADDVAACVAARANYVGLVFFPKSPRHLEVDMARDVALSVPVGLAKVALTVDATDAELDALIEAVPLDMLQLHGHETPDRVVHVRSRYGLPVMKAVGIADEGDLPALSDHLQVADQILVDAKPPKSAQLPGGNGLTFDWRLIAGRRWPVPWMLAGGLNLTNVADALRLTGADQVDVSSGVERAPGVKDAAKIVAFCDAARMPARDAAI